MLSLERSKSFVRKNIEEIQGLMEAKEYEKAIATINAYRQFIQLINDSEEIVGDFGYEAAHALTEAKKENKEKEEEEARKIAEFEAKHRPMLEAKIRKELAATKEKETIELPKLETESDKAAPDANLDDLLSDEKVAPKEPAPKKVVAKKSAAQKAKDFAEKYLK